MTHDANAKLIDVLKQTITSQAESYVILQHRFDSLLAGLNTLVEYNKIIDDRLVQTEENTSTNASCYSFEIPLGPESFQYASPKKISNAKAFVLNLLQRVFPEDQIQDIEKKYRLMTSKALKICKAFMASKNKEGKPWKSISPQDRFYLFKQTADEITTTEGEMKFVYDCEDLWPVKSLVQTCWTNRAKKFNEKSKKKNNDDGNNNSLPTSPVSAFISSVSSYLAPLPHATPSLPAPYALSTVTASPVVAQQLPVVNDYASSSRRKSAVNNGRGRGRGLRTRSRK